jgi:hypothetical protein
MEEWRSIPGFPLYEASSLGRIRRKAGTPRTPTARILRPRTRTPKPGRLPYLDVALSSDGKIRTETVHKLVALAFHGPKPSDRHEVAHADGDPSNNASGNIRWATIASNKEDYCRHGKTFRDASGRRRGADGRFLPQAA